MLTLRRPGRLAAVLLAAVTALTACGPKDEGSGPAGDAEPAKTLNIVAGSEQRSILDQVVVPWCESKGYTCNYTLLGSVDQARLLQSGGGEHDAFWFASSVFSQLGNTNGQLTDVKPMFLTPVVYAGFKPTMQKLGMVGKDVTAAQIIASVESKQAKTWATNPTQSNSGATTLFSFLNHFAGNPPGQALTAAQLKSEPVVKGMQTFIQSIERTPPSTGTMMDDCLANPDACQTMFTYEDLVIEKNLELVKQGKEPLYVAYPRGAMAISDAPLGFAKRGQADEAAKHAIFIELQNHLLKDKDALAKVQGLGRRPAGGVGLSLANADPKVFNPDWGIKATLKDRGVTFPSAPVIEAALNSYHTTFRKPVHLFYCLDSSGSMTSNGGWDGVKEAAEALFDPDQAKKNLLQTASQDITEVAIFNGDVVGGPWRVNGNADADLRNLQSSVVNHDAGGGTNMYACLFRAASALQGTDAKHKKLVVVMSDGQSENSQHDVAMAAIKKTGAPVVTIAFGSDADPNQMQEVATSTNGSFVQKDNMVAALREAAGYR
ncbi:vWA domain-containing protein [Luteococcus sp. H138]|uniref:vWA domain-containing protein n=1 Tax=unclassified Luteococcus TaxID=2639923 RepID=UPI00313D579D